MIARYVRKELSHRANRTMANVLGMAIGIALFVSISAVSIAYRKAASQPFADIGADLVVQKASRHQAAEGRPAEHMRGIRLPFSNQLLSSQDLEIADRAPGVDSFAHALLLWEFTRDGFRTIMGVDEGPAAIGARKVKDWVKEGRFPAKAGEAALEKHFAKFRKIRRGDTFLIDDKPFTVVGLIEIKQGAQVAAANIYLPLAIARDLLGTGGDAVNVSYLRLKDASAQNRVKSRLASEIPEASIQSSDSLMELLGGVSVISEKFSWLACLVALLGATALVMKAMLGNLMERTREIGILKAMGWTGQDVRRQLAAEALVQTVLGGLLGIAAGYLLSFGLGSLSISMPVPWDLDPLPAMARQAQEATRLIRLPVEVSFRLAAQALGLTVGIGLLAGWVLGVRCAKMKPADIMRHF